MKRKSNIKGVYRIKSMVYMGEMGLHAKVKLSWKRRCKAASWKNINISMIKILYMHGIY